MRTAAIYARVSTSGQAKDGTSLDTQTDACRECAQKHGYEAIKVVREDMSGARLDRPGLDSIRDMADRGEIEAVVVYDPDRLSRNLGHLMLFMEEFQRQQVQLLFVNAPQDDSPEGRMLMQLRGAFSEYERTKIIERTRRGKERTIRNGKVLGSRCVSYGYRYSSDFKDFGIDSDQAVWVEHIFAWMVTDHTPVRTIARRLNDTQVPTKTGTGKWTCGTIYSILTNPVYKGLWTWNKRKVIHNPTSTAKRREKKIARPPEEWITVEVPAIVSPEVWEAAQRQLQRNKEQSTRRMKSQYLLRGLLYCQTCNLRLGGHSRPRKDPTAGIASTPAQAATCSGLQNLAGAIAITRISWNLLCGQRSCASSVMKPYYAAT